MKVAEAIVGFIGDFSEVDAGLGVIPEKALGPAKKVGDIFKGSIGAGIMAGGAAMTAAASFLVSAGEPIERAQATLKAAVEQTGRAFDETYQKKVEEAVKSGEKFGHGTADTQEALAKLTLGFKDPQKALEQMKNAEELAAMKHISLSDAASTLVKVHAGATRVLKDFGINIKDSATLLADAAKAAKAHDAAVSGLSKAQAALTLLEQRDAGVKKLSVAQQQQLAAAHKAVQDAQEKVSVSTKALSDADAAAQGVTKNGEKIFDKLISNYKGAEDQSDTFGGKILSAKTKVSDFVGELGGKAGPVLAATGPAMMTVGGVIQSGLVPAFAKLIAGLFTTNAEGKAGLVLWAAQKVAMGVSAAASGIMTAAQWALNVALNANPIGLVVLAIAALVGGVILAYNKVGWFRDSVNKLWKEVQILWTWLAKTLGPAIGDIAGVVGKFVGTEIAAWVAAFNLVKTIVGDVWDALKGFGAFLQGAFTSAINAVAGPLGKVGDALNALNPFAKHSPSLVENVIAGTDIIRGRYTALSGMAIAGPSLGGVGAGAGGPGGVLAGAMTGLGGATIHQEITLTGTPESMLAQLDTRLARNNAEIVRELRSRGV